MIHRKNTAKKKLECFEIRIYKKDVWKVVFLFLALQTVFLNYATGTLLTVLSYLDEMIAAVIGLKLLLKAYNEQLRLDRSECEIILFLVGFEAIGIFSGILYKYQSLPYMIVDAFTCVKFLIFYLGAKILTAGELREGYSYRLLNTVSKIIAVVFFGLTLNELFGKSIFPHTDYRYFAYSMQLFFSHPTALARACATFIVVLAYNMKWNKSNIVYIYMLEFVMFMTFRSKAIAAGAIILLIYFCIIKFQVHSRLVLGVASIGMAFYIGVDALNNYYTSSVNSPRYIMTMDSFKLAFEYFPLGTGFGSFASSMAAQHYSRLYVDLGYSSIPELGPQSEYLSDTFWPILLAESGWIGTILFMAVLLVLLKTALNYFNRDNYMFWTMISILCYDFISSFGETAFFHPSAMAVYLLLGLLTSETQGKAYRASIAGRRSLPKREREEDVVWAAETASDPARDGRGAAKGS